MAEMEVLGKKKLAVVGKCIYCGSTENLTDEHIVPFGLGGNVVLPKSSCKVCAESTRDFEATVLNWELQDIRVLLNIQSRTGHESQSKGYPLTVEKRGKVKTYNLYPQHHPILVHFLRFPLPGILRGIEKIEGQPTYAIDTLNLGMPVEHVFQRLNIQAIKQQTRHHPVQFAKLVAKIAYAQAYASGEIQKLAHPSPILPSLRNEEDTIGYWVGCFDEPNIGRKEVEHRVEIVEDIENGYLLGEVQLFSNLESPRYIVFLGHTRPISHNESKETKT